MSVCGVLHCKNNYYSAKRSGKTISFHRVPEKSETKSEWIKRCHLPQIDVTSKKPRVCSLHFQEEDFMNDRLSPSALPSKLLPGDVKIVKEQMDARKNLELEVQELKKKLKDLEAENTRLKSEIDVSSREVTVYKNALEKLLTPLQINVLTKGLKKTKWTELEMSKAMLLKKISSKAYDLIQSEWNVPLPSERTIRRWCSEIDFQPGILHTILRLLKEKFDDQSLLYKQCMMGMDEMSINSEIAYDPKNDMIFGPYKKMMVVCIRGLFKAWKQPVYFNFDVKMSKEWINEIIMAVESYGFNVQGLVCDSATTNVGLFNELSESFKISEDTPGFLNPANGEEILTFPDYSHLIKLFRNNTLDHGFKLSDGTSIKKEDFQRLINANRSELNSTFKLADKHITVHGRERQRVNLAYQFFSETTGNAFEQYYPEKPGLSKFVKLINDASDVMNSRIKDGNGNWKKSAYGQYFQQQEEILTMFANETRTMRHYTVNGVSNSLLPFQRTTLINIESTRRLFRKMEDRFKIKYLLTARLNQDYIENIFSSVRGLGLFNSNPSPIECIYRLKTLLITRTLHIPQSCSASVEKCWDGEMQAEILKYLMQKETLESEDEQSSREAAEAAIVLEQINNDTQLLPILPSNWQEFNDNLTLKETCSFGGEEYLAGYIGSKIKESWMRLAPEEAQRSPESWCQVISRGNLTTPSYTWLNQFRELNKYFIDFHKTENKYSYNECKGVIRLLQEKLIICLPHIKPHVIKAFVRIRTFVRIKYLNKLRMEKSQVEYRRRLLRSNF